VVIKVEGRPYGFRQQRRISRMGEVVSLASPRLALIPCNLNFRLCMYSHVANSTFRLHAAHHILNFLRKRSDIWLVYLAIEKHAQRLNRSMMSPAKVKIQLSVIGSCPFQFWERRAVGRVARNWSLTFRTHRSLGHTISRPIHSHKGSDWGER
jgi:hypothetical protein